ncbi:MAG TPA: thioredoxin family protein [Candidatus Xenobia bacterium]|jgi:thiol-disulfide isomerase/thioredoxin
MPFDFRPHFEHAVPYDELLRQHAKDHGRARWQAMYDQAHLTPEQRSLLAGFQRHMPVLCLTGVWCGDCVNACPVFQRIAEASPRIDLRFVHRAMHFDGTVTDPETELAAELSICGGYRVPVLVFLSEDGYECERFGERTLATYRDKAVKMQGASCPIGGALPTDLVAANVQEWVDHFERIQLMLLTSPRLMQRHAQHR